MAEKSTVLGITSNLPGWIMTVSVSISNVNTEIFTTVTVTGNQFNGGGAGWKQKIKLAIIAKAQSDYGITVDQVLFPDFTVL